MLQRARDEREAAATIAALRAELTEASVPVIERPSYDDRDRIKALPDLVTDKGKTITPARHKSCPGHAAYIVNDWRGTKTVYVCTQWGQAGHRDRYTGSGRAATAPMTDTDKQQRREVIANNKAWKSAETVRHAWLKRFLARKSAPKGASVYLAAELARGIHELRRGMERNHQLATALLGLKHTPGHREAVAAATTGVTDARAQVIALGVVLGDIEESTGPHTWRNTSDTTRRYFAFLTANGYTLSDVEKLAAAGPSRNATAPTSATDPHH